MSGIEWLKTLHTQQLLTIKNECYESFGRWGYCHYGNVLFSFSREDLKTVLSERPHIPNGRETKQIRQTAANQKVRCHQSSK